MTKIRSIITKYFKISWNDLAPHRQSSHYHHYYRPVPFLCFAPSLCTRVRCAGDKCRMGLFVQRASALHHRIAGAADVDRRRRAGRPAGSSRSSSRRPARFMYYSRRPRRSSAIQGSNGDVDRRAGTAGRRETTAGRRGSASQQRPTVRHSISVVARGRAS